MMISQKKMTFQRAGFNHRVGVDPKYVEKNWKVLEHGLDGILSRNLSGLCYEELYRSAYIMVLHKFGEKLYSGVVTTITSHVRQKIQSIESAQGEIFLEELNRSWIDHNKALQMIKDVLMYLERTYIPMSQKTHLHELGLNLWRDVGIHSEKARLKNTLLQLVHRERDGEVINRDLIKNTLRMLMDLGFSVVPNFEKMFHPKVPEYFLKGLRMGLGFSVYKETFEMSFLTATENYYHLESKNLIKTCDCGEYLKEVERRLKEE